jgi:hypothetical protein
MSVFVVEVQSVVLVLGVVEVVLFVQSQQQI